MITLKQAKDYIDITCVDSDALITDLIEYAIEVVHNHIGGSLEVQEYVEYLQGSGRQYLVLSKPAIQSIFTVTIDDEIKDSSTYSIRKGMLFSRDIWEKTFLFNNCGGRLVDHNIEVKYTYGYLYPTITSSVNTGDVPKELQYVIVELVKRMFILSGTQQQISSSSGGQKQASFNKSYFETKIEELIDKDIMRILKKYK